MKYELFVVLLFLLSQNNFAQRCTTVSSTVESKISSNTPNLRHGSISIPIVFHIVYNDEDQNISDNRILSQIEVLNSIFDPVQLKLDESIPEEFRYLAENPKIHFCLASYDPLGNSTTGIVRKKTNISNIACKKQGTRQYIMDEKLGGSKIWDPQQYLNIFVGQRDDCPFAEAVFPELATDTNDGIIVDPRFVGINHKNFPYHRGYTIVHEVGHYLGLHHLTESKTEGDCTKDDMVDDTPLQSVNYFNCPSYPQISCERSSMFMNYMSLVDDDCMALFTKGQVSRMQNQIGVYRPYFLFYSCDKTDASYLDQLIIKAENNYWIIADKFDREWFANMSLFNMQGQLVWEGANEGHVFKFVANELHNFTAGIYFLEVRWKSERKIFKMALTNY